MELEVEAAIEREIELERARLKMSEDAHLSNEVERIRNTIETIHGGGSAAGCVNFRPAVDGLMHHARTEVSLLPPQRTSRARGGHRGGCGALSDLVQRGREAGNAWAWRRF